MPYQQNLQQINELQEKIEAYGKFSKDVLQKINYKFRLEWNYTSNKMEGNTLTVEETRSVMVGNVNVHNKPLKDVLEMQGHDKVISDIINIGKGNLNISETRIREIHKAIMYEDSPEKQAQIGVWKRQPNHIINYKNEKYDFTSPDEVPDKMHQLINWLSAQKEITERQSKQALHPVHLAFEFHLKFLTIHPFYDGNGRSGRILTNLILISYGYPPIYVKESEKNLYYTMLAEVQGYGAAEADLYNLLAGYLIRSMKLITDAVQGKNIEEPDDIDKEIDLFKKSLDKTKVRTEVRSRDNTKRIIENSAITLFDKMRRKLCGFNDLFDSCENRIVFSHDYQGKGYDIRKRIGGNMLSTANFPVGVYTWLERQPLKVDELTNFGMEYYFKAYKMTSPFDIGVLLNFRFEKYTYHLTRSGTFIPDDHYVQKNYDDALSEEDLTYAVNDIAKEILRYLKEKG